MGECHGLEQCAHLGCAGPGEPRQRRVDARGGVGRSLLFQFGGPRVDAEPVQQLSLRDRPEGGGAGRCGGADERCEIDVRGEVQLARRCKRIGEGMAAARLRGEQNADPMRPGMGRGSPEFLANHAGGVAGGISTGQPVVVRVAFKPTSSILIAQPTVTREGEATELATKGRHDPCVGIRGTPVVAAMMALVLADHKLLHRAQCG